jgi:tripartite-type tricarboxylate transporter receptor subunit TctC
VPATRRRAVLSAALAGLAAPALAQADGFPQRNVTLIVPSAPGGTLDALARFFAQAMAPHLGRGVVVENVSGAGGLIGMQRVTRAEPDGHVLGFGNMGVMAAFVGLNPDAGYDPRRDLAPVGIAAHVPMVLAASPRGDVRDLAGLLARLREKGEGVTFGTAGLGTTSHLAPAYLLHLTGLRGTLVAYRGAGPAMNDLAAGVVEAVIDQTVTMIPAHRGRTAVALAVSGAARLAQIPDVPTFAEAGVPAFDLVIWNAIAAPRGTPPAVLARLAAALEGALADAELRRRLEELAAVPPTPEERGPEALGRRIAADAARWIEVARAAGLARQQ